MSELFYIESFNLFVGLIGKQTEFFLHPRLLCDNRFEGSLPMDLGRLNLLSEFQFDDSLLRTGFTGIGGVSRKFGHW